MLKVRVIFQVTVLDEESRTALLRRHVAPDLGDQQADVVVHPRFQPIYPAAETNASAGEQIGNERVVQIDDAGQCVEGPLVSAPSEPAPVVEGDLPVMLQMNPRRARVVPDNGSG
jgi:hypothetical protein